MQLPDIVQIDRHPIAEVDYQRSCKAELDAKGVLSLAHFMTADALDLLAAESHRGMNEAHFCSQHHSVYLAPPDPAFAAYHPRNRPVVSSKGCICDDMVAGNSPLRLLYDSPEFRAFVMAVTGENALHPYADSLSSINIHYANRGQELGWH